MKKTINNVLFQRMTLRQYRRLNWFLMEGNKQLNTQIVAHIEAVRGVRFVPWACGCVSAAPCKDSPVCCEPGWLCCARFSGYPFPGPAGSVSSATLAFASGCYGALPAVTNTHTHTHMHSYVRGPSKTSWVILQLMWWMKSDNWPHDRSIALLWIMNNSKPRLISK